MIRRWLRRLLCISSPSEVFARAWVDNFYHGWWIGTHRRVWPMRYTYNARARRRLQRTAAWGEESDAVLCRRLPEALEHVYRKVGP